MIDSSQKFVYISGKLLHFESRATQRRLGWEKIEVKFRSFSHPCKIKGRDGQNIWVNFSSQT